jgi:hypothetical protein
VAVKTMTNHWYRLAVFALWVAAMGWLTVRKILPPFFSGDPPAYESQRGDKPRPPVGWYLYVNKKRVGWALSEINQQAADTTQIHSLVHFGGLPLGELVPPYLGLFLKDSVHVIGTEMEVESELITNSALKQIVSFYSKFHPPKMNQNSIVKIDGSVEGDKLKVEVRVGDWNPRFELPLPSDKVRDNFSPEMEVHGLFLGQSWTIVSYSPLALPNPLDALHGETRPPTEILYAKVEEQASMSWNGMSEPMWVIVYRRDPDDGPGSEKNVRNRIWVHPDGVVVRQEVYWGEHCLTFERMTQEAAVRLSKDHPEFSKEHLPPHP